MQRHQTPADTRRHRTRHNRPALAYTHLTDHPSHPERVSEIVIAGVATTRRSEIDRLYRGAGRFFPEQWERFLDGAGGTPRDGDIVAAHARLMGHPDPAVREKAMADWCAPPEQSPLPPGRSYTSTSSARSAPRCRCRGRW
ncbi:hypothetical protein Snoj_26550 [Streptomyces nojiriensis]|uniref:Uncharacterized protein n=1 Tax=Streptomyces nojiriensis TaxID=66374 RepID=A0ABQ3SL16_9ACTN|nr:hypothetical protein GCM10010205_70150 [Streptomyces nojiriensis]GHI68737.1 hypothetical protein Snoj_26550 [Streptomyces nojiriensis]